MGGRPSISVPSTLGRPKCARIKYSLPPGKLLMFLKNNSTYYFHILILFNFKHLLLLNETIKVGVSQRIACIICSLVLRQLKRNIFFLKKIHFITHKIFIKLVKRLIVLNKPHKWADFWYVFDGTDGSLEFGRISVTRNGNDDFYIVGCTTTLELTLRLKVTTITSSTILDQFNFCKK